MTHVKALIIFSRAETFSGHSGAYQRGFARFALKDAQEKEEKYIKGTWSEEEDRILERAQASLGTIS